MDTCSCRAVLVLLNIGNTIVIIINIIYIGNTITICIQYLTPISIIVRLVKIRKALWCLRVGRIQHGIVIIITIIQSIMIDIITICCGIGYMIVIGIPPLYRIILFIAVSV